MWNAHTHGLGAEGFFLCPDDASNTDVALVNLWPLAGQDADHRKLSPRHKAAYSQRVAPAFALGVEVG